MITSMRLKLAALLAAVLLLTSLGTSLASAAQGNSAGNCRPGFVCLSSGGFNGIGGPHHTDYFYYGYDNLSNVLGRQWIVNNQTGYAKVYLCKGYNGTQCLSQPITAVDWQWVDMTPINSIRLTP